MAKKHNRENARAETKKGSMQTFSLAAPAAMNVQLVGDFTQWQQYPVNMQKDPDGIWRAICELEPGPHHYRFLVDGPWQDDPECTLCAPNLTGATMPFARWLELAEGRFVSTAGFAPYYLG